MKEKIFMIIVVLFLISCGEVFNNTADLEDSTSYGLGLYNEPILVGDIVEKAANDIYVSGQDVENNFPTVTLKPNGTTLVNGALSPISVKHASTFEVVSAISDNIHVITSCHTGLANNNCMSTFTYTPKCNGQVFSRVKLQADTGGAKVINVIGNAENFPKQCEKDLDDNITMTISDSHHQFKNINEIFYFSIDIDKPAKNGYKYSANGAVNGFYYSYECFYNNNKKCTGFVKLTGKIGAYQCMGATELNLKIRADYFEGAKSVNLNVKGLGIGRDKNYKCQQ